MTLTSKAIPDLPLPPHNPPLQPGQIAHHSQESANVVHVFLSFLTSFTVFLPSIQQSYILPHASTTDTVPKLPLLPTTPSIKHIDNVPLIMPLTRHQVAQCARHEQEKMTSTTEAIPDLPLLPDNPSVRVFISSLTSSTVLFLFFYLPVLYCSSDDDVYYQHHM